MFGIGGMKQRLSLQQENQVADTGGGNVLSWTTIKIIWASVEPLSGREQRDSERVQGITQYRSQRAMMR